MEKKFVYRKLRFDNKEYYQLYKIVDSDEEINITEKSPGANVSEFYQDNIQVQSKLDISDLLYTYYYLDGEDIVLENDVLVINKLHDAFYNHFKDFDYIPKNDFDVSEIGELCKQKLAYQDEVIDDTLRVIKSNLDILDSNISDDKKMYLKHNIILYGPSGFGKKTFAKTVMDNTSVPCTIIELTSDTKDNLRTLINGLISASFGNLRKAEHGIVIIKDNFNELFDSYIDENDNEINPYSLLDNLMMYKNAVLGKEDSVTLDLSKVTYILLKDTFNNNIDYLFDDGMSQSLYDKFQVIHCFNRLSKVQIKDIIMSDPNSALNSYKEVCNSLGIELVIEDDFLDTLINRAYYGEGGIALINNYIESMIKVKWNNKKIILNKELVEIEVADTSYLEEDANEYSDTEAVVSESSNDESSNEREPFKLDVEKIRHDFKEKLPKLLEYIKGQDEPLKNILFHAIINDAFQNSNLSPSEKKERINHLLIRGGTGTGKSYITGLIAKNLNNKPFVVADCKRYTQAGFKGKDIDDILIQLYYAAGGDLQKAQKGIVVLDEFDKLARKEEQIDGVAGGAIQESLLKLLEGAVFDLEIKENGYSKVINFDTRETSFIGAGAFEGLDKIRDKRLNKISSKSRVGFGNNEISKENEPIIADENFTLEDMQKFGMDAQVLRRMSFHCDLNKLTKEDYKDIMLNSKSSSFKIKCELIELFGIKVVYDDEFIDEFTKMVEKLGYGASGISILTERIFSSFETKILDKNYKEVILTKECIIDPKKVILVENLDEEKTLKKQI